MYTIERVMDVSRIKFALTDYLALTKGHRAKLDKGWAAMVHDGKTHIKLAEKHT